MVPHPVAHLKWTKIKECRILFKLFKLYEVAPAKLADSVGMQTGII